MCFDPYFLFISASPEPACFGLIGWLVLSCLWFVRCSHEVRITNATLAVVTRALTLEVLEGSVAWRCFCNSKLNSEIVKWSKIVTIKKKIDCLMS